MESLKEIAQRLAPDYWKRDQWNLEYFDSVGFAEALISAYKAELLKEVGEPVGLFDVYNGDSYIQIKPEYSDETTVKLYTSDQLAAAILKATKPLEEEIEKLSDLAYTTSERLYVYIRGNDELRAQLAAAQEQQQTTFLQLSHALRIAEEKLAKAEQLWQVAQGRCDGLEEKLAKAEQRVAEWQPIETAPKDGRELILLLTPSNWPQVAYSNTWWISGFSVENKPTHWMPLPKAPANGASS